MPFLLQNKAFCLKKNAYILFLAPKSRIRHDKTNLDARIKNAFPHQKGVFMRKFFKALTFMSVALFSLSSAFAADSAAQEAASSPIVHDAFKDKVLYVGCESAFAPFTLSYSGSPLIFLAI